MTGSQVTLKKRKRVRAVEELYLNGYCAKEIHDLLAEIYGVTYGTIRNDIVDVRKLWANDIEKRGDKEGGARYLASLRQVRRKAMSGWEEKDNFGRKRIQGRSFKLAHDLDKEIARMSGVALKSDDRTIHLDIQAARGFMEDVMTAVFSVIEDPSLQEKIIAALEDIGTKGNR